MPNNVLCRLLDENVRFDFAARGTVNHLPMALVALARMGAPEMRLIEYFEWWEENRALPRVAGGARVERAAWQRHIGERDGFAALAEAFRSWIADRGRAETVGTVFPVLSRGLAAAAFHGLIRLAYGIEADHSGEIAAGLAGLCSRYRDLGCTIASAAPAGSVEHALERIARALEDARFAGDGIIGKMQAAVADPRFAAALSQLPAPAERLLGDLAAAGIRLYWQTGDFTVLHMVTAVHAARTIFDRFPELAAAEAIDALWGAFCAAYAAAGAPLLQETEVPSALLPWPEIMAAAMTSKDDHVIKMTYSCHCEQIRYGGPVYQAAAARLVTIGTA